MVVLHWPKLFDGRVCPEGRPDYDGYGGDGWGDNWGDGEDYGRGNGDGWGYGYGYGNGGSK